MDVLLGAAGFDGCLSSLNCTEPEEVADIHRLQRAAGADCALSNTAGATRDRLAQWDLDLHLDEICSLGVRLAREAGFPHVLGVITPTLGGEGSYELYREQALSLAGARPDGFALLGFEEVADALSAARACRAVSDLPVVVCMRFSEEDELVLRIPDTLSELAAVAPDAFGVCGMAPASCLIAVAAAARAGTKCPVAFPNLGERENPDVFADLALNLVRVGARLIGADGPGASAACTGAAFATVGGLTFDDGGDQDDEEKA